MNPSESEARLSDAAAEAAYVAAKDVVMEESDDPNLSGIVVAVALTKRVKDDGDPRHEFIYAWRYDLVNVDPEHEPSPEEKDACLNICDDIATILGNAIANYSEE